AEVDVAQSLVRRARKARGDALDFFGDQRCRAALQMRPLGFDLVTELVGAALLHQDLDARLVNIVAPAVAVIDAQDRLEIREQMRPRQEFADARADYRRAAKPPADQHAEADLALLTAQRVQADVVHRHRGAVGLRGVYGGLELAGQEGELRKGWCTLA